MPYRYIIMEPDGSTTCETHIKAFEYEEVRKLVGGLVQIVPYFSSLEYEGKKYNRGTTYANEEGYMHNLPLNPRASQAWMKACPTGDPKRMILMGRVVFVHRIKEEADGKAS